MLSLEHLYNPHRISRSTVWKAGTDGPLRPQSGKSIYYYQKRFGLRILHSRHGAIHPAVNTTATHLHLQPTHLGLPERRIYPNTYIPTAENMSDFEDDIDNQLLELAGATEKKKKRRQPSNGSGGAGAGGSGKTSGSSKKRRAEYVLVPLVRLLLLR